MAFKHEKAGNNFRLFDDADPRLTTCFLRGGSRAARENADILVGLLNRGAAAERLAERLAEAIRAHRSQKADDRCVEDDDALYAALGDGVECDRRVGDKAVMLRNCERFIERRCEGGGWLSYRELEQQLDASRSMTEKIRAELVSAEIALAEAEMEIRAIKKAAP